jgi:signal transduction histidine kinase
MTRDPEPSTSSSIDDLAAQVLIEEQREANQNLVLATVRAHEEADNHKRVSEELRRLQLELEARVEARTADLARANGELREQIARREHAEAARTALLRKLATVEEDERRRVAGDLHDQTGQLLVGLSLTLRAVARAAHLSPETHAQLGEAQRMTDELGRQIHGLALRLRPTALDDLGLPAALEPLVREWGGRTGVAVDLAIVGLDGGTRLPSDAETVLFRVVQEALSNVAKHARASNVSIVVSRHGGYATATVEDDGIGFDVESAGHDRLGLVGMRERVTLADGTLDIESTPGAGATVIARIPLRE